MTTIYWFSGTGNSLALARDIARHLGGDVPLVPIASLGTRPVTVEGAFGVVCPVYFYGLPLVVREFLGRMRSEGSPYAFAALTAGGFAGRAPVQARALLRRAGKDPDAVYVVTTPGNYIAMYDVRGAEARQRAIAGAHEAAERIAAGVKGGATAFVHASPAARAMNAVFYATFGREFSITCRRRDRRFFATEACTHCGACSRVCPVGNIDLVDGRPRWRGHCEQCFACIHWCPEAAIQIRRTATAKRSRYHHPGVSLDDIGSQRRRPE